LRLLTGSAITRECLSADGGILKCQTSTKAKGHPVEALISL
jgi:hypothetical protein